MKNILTCIVVSALLFACSSSKKTNYNMIDATTVNITEKEKSSYAKNTAPIDTFAYVSDFLKHKEKYINKPLEVLLNDLKLPIKSYMLDGSMRIGEFPDMTLLFINRETYFKAIPKNVVYLGITWQTPLYSTETNPVQQKSKGDWQIAKSFYEKQIIKDFSVVSYIF